MDRDYPGEFSKKKRDNQCEKASEWVNTQEKKDFSKEMENTRNEWIELKKNINTLMQQMENVSLEWASSKERVSKIEQDLNVTEEINVNQRVLLERSVETQKEKDSYATRVIRSIYSDLALVICEHNQLQERVRILENHTKEQQDDVYSLMKKMEEYSRMLQQAQDTIQMLQEPKAAIRNETAVSSYIQSPPLGPQQHKTGSALFYKKYF
ncbi:unnamed protein product [Rhizopus stolonifer]